MEIFLFKNQANMKPHLITIYLLVFSFAMSMAQSDVIVQDRLFRTESHHAFVVSVERSGIKDKDIEKMWKSYLKNFDTKPKFDKDAKMYVAEDAQVSKISNAPLQVFMRKNNLSDAQTEFTVWLKDSNGNFVGSAASDAKKDMASQWVLNYAIYIKRNQVEELLDDKEDDLRSLEKEKEKLDKEIKSGEKEIEKLREDIEDEEKTIREAKEELPEVEKKLNTQRSEVEKLKRTMEELESRSKQ